MSVATDSVFAGLGQRGTGDVLVVAEGEPDLTVGELLAACDHPVLALDDGWHGADAALTTASTRRALLAMAGLEGRAGRVLLAGASGSPALLPGARAVPDDAVGAPAAAPRATGAVRTRWVFATSGTSGSPKLVTHTSASLTRATARLPGARWGLLYDWHRFAGTQVVLAAVAGGGTVLVPAHARLEDRVGFLTRNRCDHLSATPSLWRRLLMVPGAAELPLRQATLGGEIADDRTLAAVAARFPGARVSHVYASTEAGAAFAVHDGRAGFPEGFLTDPPRGIALEVRGSRLHVANALVEPAYAGSGVRFVDDRGFVDTGDDVELRGGRFHFLGRSSGALNVGGTTFHPERVEEFLDSLPEVAHARVRGRASSVLGQIVVAEVVPAPGADRSSLAAEVRRRCRASLPAAMVPGKVLLVDELPLDASGKVARRD
ncbi:AMP-binding protein [Kineococcus sp. SYSU DK001]|uniref:AMP-binding protein n=1 Tax=Kineococcus sp. SYSU DK001 TaxID=3383122 RepID=UPI003D7D58CE